MVCLWRLFVKTTQWWSISAMVYGLVSASIYGMQVWRSEWTAFHLQHPTTTKNIQRGRSIGICHNPLSCEKAETSLYQPLGSSIQYLQCVASISQSIVNIFSHSCRRLPVSFQFTDRVNQSLIENSIFKSLEPQWRPIFLHLWLTSIWPGGNVSTFSVLWILVSIIW